MTVPRPYVGLTVVEAVSETADDALALAAGMAGRILADLGAQVVTVAGRNGDVDDSTRLFLSHGKRIVARGSTPDAAISKLLASADVAIVDHGLAKTLGLDVLPPVRAVLSLFGGRLAGGDGPASAFTLAALGGLLAMVGDPAREPLRLGGHQEGFSLGLSAYCGLAAALARPGPAAAPRTIRASLLETVIWLNWKAVPLEAGEKLPQGRAGAAAEWQVLRCADGHAVLVYQEPDWPRLTAALADPALEAPRFATRRERLANAAELAGLIERRFMAMTRREIHDLARRHRLPLGPVWNLDEAMDDPHNRIRDLFVEIGAGKRAPRLPVVWLRGAADALGAVEDAAQ